MNSHRLRASVAITVALLMAGMGSAAARDTRTVTEPVYPPSCTVLVASADAPGKDDTARIQSAIEACPTGHAVRLASSNEKKSFLAGPLALRSGVTLIVDAGATLYASTDPARYDRGQKTCGTIDKQGKGCKPFISLDKVKSAAIMGEGTIDGQGGNVLYGHAESWWQLARRAQKEDAHQNVPRLVEATGSQDLTLYKITLRNSPNFHVTLNQVDGFTAWGVKIDTPHNARNTDGIDPISTRNVTIAHSFIRTGDDNVAIKAGKYGPSENISILHNHFYTGHGMSIGSETNGGVRNVLVEDLAMDGATSGLRIKSDISRGGEVSGITYRDVCMRNVKAPIDLATDYNPRAAGKLVPQFNGILFDRVASQGLGRVVMKGYDAAHPIRAEFRQVAVPSNDRRIEHVASALKLDSSDAPSCSERFAAFPEASPRSMRPQLDVSQAKRFAYDEVLKYVGKAGAETVDPWDPLADPLAKGALFQPDLVVDGSAGTAADGKRTFTTVQAAISKAVSEPERRNRIYILVKPGSYRELVYVPSSPAPITLYGEGASAADTRISATLDAAVTGASYTTSFGKQFDNVHDSIRAMYDAIRERAVISTNGAMVAWVRNHGFQARNITFENAYNKATGNARSECSAEACAEQGIHAQMNRVHHQAVALQVEGADKVQFENVRLVGFQDTLYLRSAEPAVTVRSFFNKSYIEGDVDFIFGDTTAYFRDCEVKSLGDRGTSYVAAPSTNHKTRYGFVFDGCHFTHDGSQNAMAGKFYLARQWFHNQRCTPYGAVALAGYSCKLGDVNVFEPPKGSITRTALETVGKMVVLNSRIGAHINKTNPWSDWNKNGTLPYRPAQFSSDDYWTNLRAAGIDPVQQLGYSKQPSPTDIYLGEYNNANE